MDTKALKEQCDLRQLVAQDLGMAHSRSGRAHLWKCPFHQERKGYSLAVWQDGYCCFGACGTGGDALDWLMQYRRLNFHEALAVLGKPASQTDFPAEQAPHSAAHEPPCWKWQQAAGAVVQQAEEWLWSTGGEPALTYLCRRGLNTTTISQARLGYIPGDYRERKTIAGLEIPCGITIPWFAAGALWAVKVRRAYGMPKYLQITGGSSHGLYNADLLPVNAHAMFCEGEFDTLIVQQEAGKLVSPVTLGSAANRLSVRWLQALITHQKILVSYDDDAAGQQGTRQLVQISPRFQPLKLPHSHDITDFYLSVGDVYAWVEAALCAVQSEERETTS